MSPQVLAVGDRLQIGRDHATVRYIGEVSGQRDVWAGLEWDDPSRGKHNGSTAGHQYFKCLVSGAWLSCQDCVPLLPPSSGDHPPPI